MTRSDMTMDTEAPLIAFCNHGNRPAAVVCRHLLTADDRVVGFVENSSDPADLQAWCDACESAFIREGYSTLEFAKFADIVIVCDLCYWEIKARNSRLL